MNILSIGKTIIECQSLDVVIFSLSLIGKNWQDCVLKVSVPNNWHEFTMEK